MFSRRSLFGAVANLKLDMVALARLSGILEVTGVTVFGNAKDDASTLHVRSFAPCKVSLRIRYVAAATQASRRFYVKPISPEFTETEYTARQGMHVDRAGNVGVRIDGESIWIGGYAVTCVDRTLRLN